MNRRLAGLLIVASFIAFSPVRADDTPPASLQDVHQILLQAAGYEADTPPTPDQQRDLLGQALKMIRTIPHVYHGQLNQASRDIEAALTELAQGDPAHKVRNDIFDADDLIKAIMD